MDPGSHQPQSHHLWDKIANSGLSQGVSSLEVYEARVRTGMLHAACFLRSGNPIGGLSIEDMRVAHRLSFEGVHPWAGFFRKPEDHATFSGLVAADPQRIEDELSLALRQMNELAQLYPLEAIAFFHMRYERIHPHRDGNGRLGRLIAAEQVYHVWQRQVMWEDRTAYFDALRAGNKGNLTPLINYFLQYLGEEPASYPIFSPFRIAPRMIGDPALADDPLQALEASRVEPHYWTSRSRP